jgi:hypothetical protein
MNITLLALMGFSLRKGLVVSAFASLVVFSSCDQHAVGELPELQKEHTLPPNSAEDAAAAPVQTPAAKPTPADFFTESKP